MPPPLSGSREGSRFGPYQIEELIGRGGMGEVYRAFDTAKRRTIALKLLNPALAGDPLFQRRFERESYAVARLGEPHVIPIHDWGEIDGILYIDMRWVDGQDLRGVLCDEHRLDPVRAVMIMTQISSALDAAHSDGLVHRDVKPENILIGANDFAYLVDFGIAQQVQSETSLTATGSAIGSFSYMAPERLDNAVATSAVDVYSLGCVLYECLSGRVPFPADTISGAVKAIVMNDPTPIGNLGSGELSAFDPVLAKALAKDPADRHATAGEFAREASRAAEIVMSVRVSAPTRSAEESSHGAAGADQGKLVDPDGYAPTEVSDLAGLQPPSVAPPTLGPTAVGGPSGPMMQPGIGAQAYIAPAAVQYGRPPKSVASVWKAIAIALGVIVVLVVSGVIGLVMVNGDGGGDDEVPPVAVVGSESSMPTSTTETSAPAVPPVTTTVTVQPTVGSYPYLQNSSEDCGNGGYAATGDPNHRATCPWVARAAEYVRTRAPQPTVTGSAFSELVGQRSFSCQLQSGQYYECVSQSQNVFWVVV